MIIALTHLLTSNKFENKQRTQVLFGILYNFRYLQLKQYMKIIKCIIKNFVLF